MKHVVLPVSQEIKLKPITPESIGLVGHTPIDPTTDFSHIKLSESLRNRIETIRFASDEKLHTANKPK